MKRIFGLLGFVILGTFVLAYPVGSVLSNNFPSGFEGFVISKSISDFSNGLFWSCLILTPLIFGIWGKGRRWLHIVIVSLPALTVSFWVGSGYLGWALIFFVSSIILTLIINHFRPKQVNA